MTDLRADDSSYMSTVVAYLQKKYLLEMPSLLFLSRKKIFFIQELHQCSSIIHHYYSKL